MAEQRGLRAVVGELIEHVRHYDIPEDDTAYARFVDDWSDRIHAASGVPRMQQQMAEDRKATEKHLEARRRLEHDEEPPAPERIDAVEVVRWVRALPDLWRMADDDQKREMVGLVYERIVIEGPRFVEVVPTPYAAARGLTALLPESVEGWNGEPRRERLTTTNRISMPVRGARAARSAVRRLRSA